MTQTSRPQPESRPAPPPPRGLLRNVSIGAKLATIVVTLIVVNVVLLSIAMFSFDISTGVRAYVGGEGLYSKGQKDAVYYLTRYALYQDVADYEKYRQAVAIPLGDGKARVEMQKPDFDYAVAAQGFLEGGNAAEDIPHLISLFRRFHDIGYFRRAIQLWSQADALVANLVVAGEELHREIAGGNLDPEREAELLSRIERINAQLTPVEREFSQVLGEAARWIRRLLLGVVLLSALVLLGSGLWISWRIARNVRAGIAVLQDAALRFSAGDLDHRCAVRSNDELGQLARSFNEMIERRQHVDAELRSANEFREKVMESVTNAIYVLDREGRFTLVNRRTCEITGYEAEDLLGESFDKLVPAEHLGEAMRLFAGIVRDSGIVVAREMQLVRRDGSRLLIAFTGAPLFKDGVMTGVVATAEDITERKRYEASLHEAKELAQVTLSSIGDGVIRTDAKGVITFCNQAAAKLLETDPEYPVGKSFGGLIHLFDDDGGKPIEDPITRVLETGKTLRLNMFSSVRTMLGKRQPIADSVAPVRDPAGVIIGAVFVFQDVRDARQMTERLAYQARHDQMTGLPNRVGFEEALRQSIALAQDRSETQHVLYMDLDHFKIVNDTCGHAAGDKLLKDVSALLRARLRPSDLLARLGGDEFAVILNGASAAVAARVAENLIAAIKDYQLIYDGRTFRIGLSIGATQINSANNDPSMIMAQADTACYAAKTSGRGRYQIYQADDAEIQLAQRSLDWAQRIESALDQRRFEVYLQRIVDGGRNEIGFETLIRMRGEEGQVISPEAFISAAKRMGWLTRIDQWMAREVLELSRRRSEAGLGGCLSLNLSAKSVADPVFVDWMLSVLDSYRPAATALRFEITETEQLEATDTAFRLVSQLRRRGYKVWLDDFGVGYNSFDLLKRLQVDGLKIDISFTRDLLQDPVDRVMVEAIVSIGKVMNLELLAEGVENDETWDALKALGVHFFQGHLFHKAEAASRLGR